jgi:hypothetical protein
MKPIIAGMFAVLLVAPLYAADEAKPASPAPAAPAAPPVGQFELKNKSTFAVPRNTRAPFIPIGWVKREGPRQVEQKIVVNEADYHVTSILLGNPALAVINGRSYEEGQYLRMPRGSTLRIRVFRIGDGQVWLQYDDKSFTVPLKRPELGERKPGEELLLNEDRDAAPAPMTAPAPGTTPIPPK